MTPATDLHVSVVIPTCNRPSDLRRCLSSLSVVEYPNWDILIVDQGDDLGTKDVVLHFETQLPHLRYYRMNERGLSRARNLSVSLTEGAVIAFLDDDCTVETTWLQCVQAVFQNHPDAALVFGTVRAAEYNPAESYIPAFDIEKERTLLGRTAIAQYPDCMGASMYLRRSLVDQIGPFDVELGAGSRLFGSAEDWEYYYRVLAANRLVVMTSSIVVCHYGVRHYNTGAVARGIRAVAYSNGAADMKLLRCGEVAALRLAGIHTSRYLSLINLRNIITFRGPTGLVWITYYIFGLVASFRLRVDRSRRLYVRREDSPDRLQKATC